MIKNYASENTQKRLTRKKIFQDFDHIQRVIGLGGPSITAWVDEWISLGKKKKDIVSYEIDEEIYMSQLANCLVLDSDNIYKGDFINIQLEKDVIYDIDLCNQAKTQPNLIRKFKGPNVVFTFSELWRPSWETIKYFTTHRQETILVQYLLGSKEMYVRTNKTAYMFYKYYDTSSMVMVVEKEGLFV